MLRSITLTNWRSHAKSRIPFSAGANLLVGSMGAGKSSVMDALCFALYGTYPKLGRRDAKLEEVTNFRHAGQCVSVEVEWDETDGSQGMGPGTTSPLHTYKVRRELDSGQAWLYADGKLSQKGPRAVTDEVERILSIPYELFSRAVYAEQNRLDAWLSLSPSARKIELDRLLGLDRFERARTASGTELNRLKERAQAAEASAPIERVKQEEAHLQQKREQLHSRQNEREAKSKESAALTQQMAALSQQWDSMEAVRKKREDLSLRWQKLSGSIAAWQKMIASAPIAEKVADLEPALLSARNQRASWEAELKSLQSAQQELSKTSGRIGEQIKNEQTRSLRAKQLAERQSQLLAKKSIEALRTDLSNLQNALQMRLAQSASLEKERENLSQVLKTLGIHTRQGGVALAECPVCHQTLDETHRQDLERSHRSRLFEIEALIAQNKSLDIADRKSIDHLSSLDAETGRLQAQLAALGEATDAGHLHTQLDENRQKGLALGAKSAELQSHLSKLSEEESKLSTRLSQAKQLQQWRDQLESAEKEHAQLTQSLSALAFDEPAYQALKLKREELTGQSARLGESLRSLEKMIEQDSQMVQMQESVLSQLQQKRAEAETARKEMDELSSFRLLLASTQSSLRSRLLFDLNAALSRIWPLVYPYGDWGRVRLIASEKDYSVEIFQNEWKALEAHASGGERACLGLALRVALSVLLTPTLGWLILDEPTHNLDSKAVQSLGVALSEALPKIVPQVIVITHENQLVESTPGRVIRFSRDKLKGEDTKVEVEGA